MTFRRKVLPGGQAWFEVVVGSETFHLDHEPASSSPLHVALAIWVHLHRQRTGCDYPLDGGRDVGHMKRACVVARVGTARQDPDDRRKKVLAPVEDPGPPLRALGNAMNAYHKAVEAGTAFPSGPATVSAFVNGIGRWLQVDPNKAPGTASGKLTLDQELDVLAEAGRLVKQRQKEA